MKLKSTKNKWNEMLLKKFSFVLLDFAKRKEKKKSWGEEI
jgi:hypothetical protein